MTELNKKRIKFLLDVLGFIMVISLVILSAYLYSANEELKSIVSEQNEYLKSSTVKDSLRNEKSENLQDSLKSYSNAILEALGKGNIDPDLFLNSFKKVEGERDSLKLIYDYAKKAYGFEMVFEKLTKNYKDSTITSSTYWSKENTPADSARMLLPYFRDRLRYDSKSKSWYIKTETNH